jgi:hypothetical protein
LKARVQFEVEVYRPNDVRVVQQRVEHVHDERLGIGGGTRPLRERQVAGPISTMFSGHI